MFSPLSKDNLRNIVSLQAKELAERMQDFGLALEMDPSAVTWIAEEGFDPTFGARPIVRALQKFVESPLATKLLAGEFKTGERVLVTHEKDEDALRFAAKPDPNAVNEDLEDLAENLVKDAEVGEEA